MRNLLQFIVQHAHLLLFLLLEILALTLVVTSRNYQRSTALTTANSVMGSITTAASDVSDYFSLRQQNNALAEENAQLRSLLSIDTMAAPEYIFPTRGFHRPVRAARVVDLTTWKSSNYLTINLGHDDGINSGMGVVCQQGVVGIVGRTSPHFALVIPVIHTETSISCRLAKNDYICFTHWDGTSYRYASLTDIARHIDVAEGDTVVTSGLTEVFERGTPVGVVEHVSLDDGDSYYNVTIRLATDFRKLDYVYVLTNPYQAELDTIQSYIRH